MEYKHSNLYNEIQERNRNKNDKFSEGVSFLFSVIMLIIIIGLLFK